jgi:hypothetical protein
MKQLKIIIPSIVIGIILAVSLWFWGRQTGINQYADNVRVDTIVQIRYDTVVKYIYKTDYDIRIDTILFPEYIPTPIDTAGIIIKFFATNVYEREWNKPGELYVYLKDSISMNVPISSTLEYKILRPDTVIHQTVYQNLIQQSKYLSLGMSYNVANPNLTGFNLTLNTPKWYGGVGYIPGIKGVELRAGITIFKFKDRRYDDNGGTK